MRNCWESCLRLLRKPMRPNPAAWLRRPLRGFWEDPRSRVKLASPPIPRGRRIQGIGACLGERVWLQQLRLPPLLSSRRVPASKRRRRQRRMLPLSLISIGQPSRKASRLFARWIRRANNLRSEEHTSELQSRVDLVCRLLLEKKKKKKKNNNDKKKKKNKVRNRIMYET